jgi:hypothetical protein
MLTKDIVALWKPIGADGVYMHLPLVVSHELSWLAGLGDVSMHTATLRADIYAKSGICRVDELCSWSQEGV